MSTPKVSVITPIYNVSSYLPQCINSLKSQTLDAVEFICIDDGSTDNSLEILTKLVDDDSRFVIITKPNQGYGATMNLGLSIAQGEYIGIVESDDYADPQMFERLYALAHEHDVDICKSSFYSFSSEDAQRLVQGVKERYRDKPFNQFDDAWHSAFNAVPSIWSAIYRRAFLLENDISFVESPGASFQDTGFVLKSWLAMSSGFFSSEAFLHYRVGRQGSSVASRDKALRVCEEYADVRAWLDRRPGNNTDATMALNARKVETYRWNARRLRGENCITFLSHIHDEFRMDQEEGLLSFSMMSPVDRSFVKELLEMPDALTSQTLAENWKATREAEPTHVSQKHALVSIVIPIYNVSDYLEECLDSVLGQTHKNLEVICVNDGSTDNSLEIMQRYAQADNRVKIIDKPNGGYGHSVNKGLEAATGEWISIIEPDDYIDKYMYQDLLTNAHDKSGHLADMVKGTYWLYFDLMDGTEPYIEAPHLTNRMPKARTEFTVFEDPEVLRHHPSIWSAIYRSDFLKAFDIKMIEPKGAGWADNPWFFETLLQAQSIVWIPAGYYYYRQTNPNASSKLRDYHMPFDRLRDIRAIFERLNIVDPAIITMLYQRSFNYIVTSILDQFGFDESEPELQGLIRETLESMDERFLLSEECKLNKRFKDYYRDFMGKTLAEVKKHKASKKPFFSFVLPMHNDREGLWDTLNSLMSQTVADFEVLCYDCNSHDRSAQIIEGVSEKDDRFVLQPDKTQTVIEGFNRGIEDAVGDWIFFLRSGISFPNEKTLEKVVSAIAKYTQNGTKVVNLVPNLQSSPLAYLDKGEPFVVDTKGFESRLVRSVSIGICWKVFDRAWLADSNVRFTNPADSDGYAFGIRAMLASPQAMIVNDTQVSYGQHYLFQRRAFEEEAELIAYEKARLDAIAEVGVNRKKSGTWRATREALLKYLDFSLGFLGKYHAGKQYFNMLRDFYRSEDLGLSDCTKAANGDFGRRIRLDRAFCNTYEAYTDFQYRMIVRDRDAARRTISTIRNSGSYKLARGVSKRVKKILHL